MHHVQFITGCLWLREQLATSCPPSETGPTPEQGKGQSKALPVHSATCLTFCPLDKGFQCSRAWDTLLGSDKKDNREYSRCCPSCSVALNDSKDSQALNELHDKCMSSAPHIFIQGILKVFLFCLVFFLHF